MLELLLSPHYQLYEMEVTIIMQNILTEHGFDPYLMNNNNICSFFMEFNE